MAELAYQKSSILGGALALVAATSGGDTLPPNSRGALMVTNGDSSAHGVTIAVPGNTQFSQPQPDITVNVPAGTTRLIGPFPAELADPSDGLVHVTYAATTSVTVAAVSI